MMPYPVLLAYKNLATYITGNILITMSVHVSSDIEGFVTTENTKKWLFSFLVVMLKLMFRSLVSSVKHQLTESTLY